MSRDHHEDSEHFLKRSSLLYLMLHVPTGPYPHRAQALSRNPSSSLSTVAMDEVQEFQESTTIKFEWTLKGLKQLFESRCGRFIAISRSELTDASCLTAAVEGKQSPRLPRA